MGESRARRFLRALLTLTRRPAVCMRRKPPVELFDCIIAGDVVYLKEQHSALLATMRRWLKPDGTAIVVCPRRQGSLELFTEQARQVFTSVSLMTDYSPEVVQTFAGDKCFPVMVSCKGHGRGLRQPMGGPLRIGETNRSRHQAESWAAEKGRLGRVAARRAAKEGKLHCGSKSPRPKTTGCWIMDEEGRADRRKRELRRASVSTDAVARIAQRAEDRANKLAELGAIRRATADARCSSRESRGVAGEGAAARWAEKALSAGIEFYADPTLCGRLVQSQPRAVPLGAPANHTMPAGRLERAARFLRPVVRQPGFDCRGPAAGPVLPCYCCCLCWRFRRVRLVHSRC